MEKKPYARIDYTNCGVDYDYSIVPFSEVNENATQIFINENEDVDEAGYKIWEEKGLLPEIKISLVMMTHKEYEKWFEENVNP